ncbi:hypothetical protein CcI156_05830 [Frankia sp. CcI156]|nr:hypothetical protein CcI6DRAFT_02859 [Frankia sp. CcI6]KFB03878.1 hypothetical protein ALLO2DRAFT_03394 [Frankia sp. Allo2]OAA29071.1 hypothetical protein AAY23_10174 [Frankia casuarinae]OHV48535.1 hypothetical protein CgIS1_05860 [Frankia sp. CgIS1]ONH28228.1 hypothetical protein CcI156_05830 [Frankia sp. CcI156]
MSKKGADASRVALLRAAADRAGYERLPSRSRTHSAYEVDDHWEYRHGRYWEDKGRQRIIDP